MRVPVLRNQKAPEALPAVREQAGYDANQFGAQVGGQVGYNARMLGQVSAYIGQKVEEVEEKESTIELNSIYRQYTEEATKTMYGEDGLFNQAKMLNAKGLTGRVSEKFDQLDQKYFGMTKNKRTLEKLQEALPKYRHTIATSAIKHEGEQFEAAEIAEEKATLTSFSEQMTFAYNNPQALISIGVAQNEYIRVRGQRAGMSPGQIMRAQVDQADAGFNGALDRLTTNGKLDEATELFTNVRGVMESGSVTKWEGRLATMKEKRTKDLEKQQEDALWNEFLLLDTKDKKGQAAFAERIRSTGNGELYDKMRTRSEKEEAEMKHSDFDTYTNFDLMLSKKDLTREEITVAYKNGLLKQSDAQNFMKAVTDQEKHGWDETNDNFIKMGNDFIDKSIRDPAERNQAKNILRLQYTGGVIKGPAIYTEAQNIISQEKYKDGTTGFFGAGKPKGYTEITLEANEKTRYWQAFGEDVVHDLDGYLGNWQETRKVFDAVGVQANDPIMLEVIRQLKGMGPLDKKLTADELIPIILNIRKEKQEEG